MKFGAHMLPTYTPELDGPVPDYYARLFDQVIEFERLGFDQAWVTEHHFGGYGGILPHPPTFLSAAAGKTSRIRLGVAMAGFVGFAASRTYLTAFGTSLGSSARS